MDSSPDTLTVGDTIANLRLAQPVGSPWLSQIIKAAVRHLEAYSEFHDQRNACAPQFAATPVDELSVSRKVRVRSVHFDADEIGFGPPTWTLHATDQPGMALTEVTFGMSEGTCPFAVGDVLEVKLVKR